MDLDDVTYQGPPVEDADLLARLPAALRGVLGQVNGFVAYGGGLHVRGACHAPAWHALGRAWCGEAALHRSYPALRPSDVPFGQDAVGDQFILRDGHVHRLDGETGALADLGVSLHDFLAAVAADPLETLALHPLLQFRREGGTLAPGQLLSVYPPFCTAEAAAGVSLRAVAADERLGFLAQFAAHLAERGDGDRVRLRVTD